MFNTALLEIPPHQQVWLDLMSLCRAFKLRPVHVTSTVQRGENRG
jgi:hypothetical protein